MFEGIKNWWSQKVLPELPLGLKNRHFVGSRQKWLEEQEEVRGHNFLDPMLFSFHLSMEVFFSLSKRSRMCAGWVGPAVSNYYKHIVISHAKECYINLKSIKSSTIMMPYKKRDTHTRTHSLNTKIKEVRGISLGRSSAYGSSFIVS